MKGTIKNDKYSSLLYGQLHDHQKSDFFGKINKFQFKWIKPLKYDVKTLETTFLKF